MSRRSNWKEFQDILDEHNIDTLYHFTDRDNLESIIQNGGLYSWADCKEKDIKIPKPGGGDLSRSLDTRGGLQRYVRVSFTEQHPMMYVAMNEGRISNPVLLEIDPAILYEEGTKFSNMNATRNGAHVGGTLADFKRIHFDAVKARRHFDLDDDERPYFQAEVLVKNFIPLKYITNIDHFGIPIPAQRQAVKPEPKATAQPKAPIPVQPINLQARDAYTAQITRNTPTAFIFLIDQSVSMQRKTTLMGEEMTLAEAVARIVNNQINELVLRCIKTNEVRHYYDIAVIGYGHEVYSGWNGELSGRFFVSPEEIKNNPYKKIVTREEVRTRKGTSVKEVEKVQWLEARCDGHWTHMHQAFEKAKDLLTDWMIDHHEKDCYPPTIINITDGQFNHTTVEHMQQEANELKSMFTNDGNVLLFNIHIVPGKDNRVVFPMAKSELRGNQYGGILYDLSSLLPLRYNQDIARVRDDNDPNVRHTAMAVNADMSTLIQLMDIGTPTNISQNK